MARTINNLHFLWKSKQLIVLAVETDTKKKQESLQVESLMREGPNARKKISQSDFSKIKFGKKVNISRVWSIDIGQL